MAVNQFLAYATAGGANVVDQATYAASSYVTTGRGSGILPSNVYNKIARQGNYGSAALGQFIVNTLGQDALDDGDLTNFVAQLTAAIQTAALQPATTGDAKLTLKNVADSGWLLMNDGTIGNVSSGANFANNTAQALFTLIWNNVTNTFAPLLTSAGAPVARGLSASADWTANRRISLTLQLGRALCIAGTGNGLTARTLGQTLGEEAHLLTVAEVPALSYSGTTGNENAAHTHNYSWSGTTSGQSNDHSHVYTGYSGLFGPSQGGSIAPVYPGGYTTSGVSNDHSHSYSGAGTSGAENQAHAHVYSGVTAGGGGSHNNMQPSAFWSIMIKL